MCASSSASAGASPARDSMRPRMAPKLVLWREYEICSGVGSLPERPGAKPSGEISPPASGSAASQSTRVLREGSMSSAGVALELLEIQDPHHREGALDQTEVRQEAQGAA